MCYDAFDTLFLKRTAKVHFFLERLIDQHVKLKSQWKLYFVDHIRN
ncbi:MAG: hypothetical protein ACI86M_001659 [Saprospiraceae bacterium]|jgi:hypothetical protein